MDICLIPAIFTPITEVVMVDCCVYLVLLVIWMIVLTKIKEVTVGVMAQDMEVDLTRSTTLTFKVMDKLLMVM